MNVVLFLSGCILVRIALAAVVAFSGINLNVAGALMVLPILGWMSIMLFWPRDFGVEVGRIWWQNLRPFHVMFWSAAAFFAFTGERNLAAATLFVDALFGLGSWYVHYF